MIMTLLTIPGTESTTEDLITTHNVLYIHTFNITTSIYIHELVE